jgi:hypothetical protein
VHSGVAPARVLPHCSFNNDPKVHAIECTGGFDAATAVACPVSAGGATIHHGRTLHYAGPNGSDAPRYAYILAFEVPPKPTASRRDFFWNREKQTANRARKSHWRRRGGVVIEVWRKVPAWSVEPSTPGGVRGQAPAANSVATLTGGPSPACCGVIGSFC